MFLIKKHSLLLISKHNIKFPENLMQVFQAALFLFRFHFLQSVSFVVVPLWPPGSWFKVFSSSSPLLGSEFSTPSKVLHETVLTSYKRIWHVIVIAIYVVHVSEDEDDEVKHIISEKMTGSEVGPVKMSEVEVSEGVGQLKKLTEGKLFIYTVKQSHKKDQILRKVLLFDLMTLQDSIICIITVLE